ncbi:MAG: PilZ domain-containing protein [Rhodospirillaceae bacterium]|jgi:hypothetical protein|nr:PilZ domain-containing protein [Rhodospirillales bacterium]MBT3907205.1 PilZ domain-containing protein [Rhodospirillaceae bacterium]MBT4700302.1 PilZ domain-containing protein [Rhodospirillaceae bacterium]MBT5036161.1 PilZ domain-containing protein [Rhodospirillaceae bacterium]MBT6218634.1 PilZ domain-containing protein [Rhodospirillaceae bacterium]
MPIKEIDRREPRFPCVGIGLAYSVVEDGHVENLGEALFSATLNDMSLSGMAFDVDRPLDSGTRVMIVVDNTEDKREHLHSQVNWCSKIEEGRYRIGVKIDHAAGVLFDDSVDTEYVHIQKGASVPVTMRFYCPACLHRTYFDFIGSEHPHNDQDVMPLYDCSGCGSTRSIPSILAYNRARSLDDPL